MKEKIIKRINKEKEVRFYAARDVLKDIIKLLKEKYDVKKIILIGSCLDKDRFHFHSDIDLCVEGLPNGLYFQILGEILMKGGEFDIDLIPKESANKRMLEHIKNGEVIYEKCPEK